MKKVLCLIAMLSMVVSVYGQENTEESASKSIKAGDFSSTGGSDQWKSTFNWNAGVDVRGWVGPAHTENSRNTQWNPDADNRNGGFSINKGRASFIRADYNYASFVGAVVILGFEATTADFAAQQGRILKNLVGLESLYGYVDILGLAQIDKYIGLRLTMGYFYFEPKGTSGRFSNATYMASPALAFEMGTEISQRGYMRDALNMRVDMPINAIEAFDMTVSFATDLDFGTTGTGQTYFTEITSKGIPLGDVVKLDYGVFYSHWTGNAHLTDLATTADPINQANFGGRNYLRGEGHYGSQTVGGSANLAISLPKKHQLNFGMAMDYEWYFGNHWLQRYADDFNIHNSNGVIEGGTGTIASGTNVAVFDTKKGNLSWEVGARYLMPQMFTLWVAYVNRIDHDRSRYSFSTNETLYAAKANTFISTRFDFTYLEQWVPIRPYVGVAVGISEARSGFWSQVGRVGYDVGIQYIPHRNITLRTGWHAGSSVIGNIYAPGTLSRQGQYYLRAAWSLR